MAATCLDLLAPTRTPLEAAAEALTTIRTDPHRSPGERIMAHAADVLVGRLILMDGPHEEQVDDARLAHDALDVAVEAARSLAALLSEEGAA